MNKLLIVILTLLIVFLVGCAQEPPTDDETGESMEPSDEDTSDLDQDADEIEEDLGLDDLEGMDESLDDLDSLDY